MHLTYLLRTYGINCSDPPPESEPSREGGPALQPAATCRSAGAICEPAATKRPHPTNRCGSTSTSMQLALRRRFRVALLGMAVLLLLAGCYAKREVLRAVLVSHSSRP